MSDSLRGALLLALAAGAAPDLPLVVDHLDTGRTTPDEKLFQMKAEKAHAMAEEGAPSPDHALYSVPALASGQSARIWLSRVERERISGMDGVTFWIRGSESAEHVQVALRAEGVAAPVYVSRVLLQNPFWHRVYLPFSEFYDRESRGTYPVHRFDRTAAGPVAIGLEVEGPTQAPLTFAMDELGLTSFDEVQRAMGWPSYMPPSHGLPPFLDRFDGAIGDWTTSGGAKVASAALEGFPREGFARGLAMSLPSPSASVSRPLPRVGELRYYEGLGFWVKGDGLDHLLDVTLTPDDGISYVFRTPVRGAQWKLVFAGFENFKRGGETLEVEDATRLLMGLALAPDSAAPARLTLGPIRLGYEK